MAVLQRRDLSNPSAEMRVASSQIRRSVRSPSAKIAGALQKSPAALFTVIAAAAVMLAVPALWFLLPPALLVYLIWFLSRRTNLPFRNPASWAGVDYSEAHPAVDGRFADSGGILSMGVTGRVGQKTKGEELWITNSDARRHMVIIGTTGSGKALPLETMVLTPVGWRRNGDLKAGDRLVHPHGGTTRVLSVHPQGVEPMVRIWFSDGRHVDCSHEHLWQVHAEPLAHTRQYQEALTAEARGRGLLEDPDADLSKLAGVPYGDRVMRACDLGILHGAYAARDSDMRCLRISVPVPKPSAGPFRRLGSAQAAQAVEGRLEDCRTPPALSGTPEDRARFLQRFMEGRGRSRLEREKDGRERTVQPVRTWREGKLLKELVWSLGGEAVLWQEAGNLLEVSFALPSSAGLPESLVGRIRNEGLAIVEVEPLDSATEMSCIRVDREDGLYVVEGYITTHNTELLLGLVSQALMWSSGFLFIDGKGTRVFYARMWSLAKRFGREDDVRCLNFMGVEDIDRPAGGPDSQTNTMNPFAKGGADNLMNLIVSLMGDAGQGNDMWKSRAMSLVTAVMKILVEMRDNGDILLNVQAVRDYLPLGEGFRKSEIGQKREKIETVEEVPEAAWDKLKERGGLTGLYLRALRGEFSQGSLLALKGFFDTLPGFKLEAALNGMLQDPKANEQHSFLSMQLTKPLGGMADDFGHIFNTPLGEVDIEDIVLNRRILIVLLPALQKAEEEMRNCGKIVVSNIKMTMAKVSGATLQGGFAQIVQADPTRSPSPMIVVLDEVGYYMVNGIDVMMAQARSLGFCIILAGQDMSAMQKVSAQIAETALANASMLAIGKTVDGAKTMDYIRKVIGEEQVAVANSLQAQDGLFGRSWVDRQEVSFQQTDRVKVQDLQDMAPGQFYFLFDSKLELARTFYIGEDFAPEFAVNRFLKIRGPLDRVPGLDQSVEEAFTVALQQAAAGLASPAPGPDIDPAGAGEAAVRTCVQAVATRPAMQKIPGMIDALAAMAPGSGDGEAPRGDPAPDPGAGAAVQEPDVRQAAVGGPEKVVDPPPPEAAADRPRPAGENVRAVEEEAARLPEPRPAASGARVGPAVNGETPRERYPGILAALIAEHEAAARIGAGGEPDDEEDEQAFSEDMRALEQHFSMLGALVTGTIKARRGGGPAGGPRSPAEALDGKRMLEDLERQSAQAA